MTGERIKLYDSPEDLADAAYAILNAVDDVDFAVVSGFSDRTDGNMFSDGMQARKAIPELIGVEEVIKDWWSENSLRGIRIAPQTLYTGFGASSNVLTHVDSPQRVMIGERSVLSYLGPLTMTIVHRLDTSTTISRFSAEDGKMPFIPNGVMPWRRYRDIYLDTMFGSLGDPRPLRSAHDQSQGEITLFRNTPNQTMHRVELIHEGVRRDRLAQVITAHLVEA